MSKEPSKQPQQQSQFQEATSIVSSALGKVPSLAIHSSSPSNDHIDDGHENCCGTSSTSYTATTPPERKTSSSSLSTPPTQLLLHFTPKSFFISWNGVLVLLFQGFPLPLEQLKESLNEECKNGVGGYKGENFGSKWAKVTLAAVREDSHSDIDHTNGTGGGSGEESFLEPLTLEELQSLKRICRECSLPFSISNDDIGSEGGDDAIESSSLKIPINSISVVEYEWRSLEKVTRMVPFPITLRSNNLQMVVSSQQRQKSSSVLSEWDDEKTYIGNVNAKGAPYRPSRICDDSDCVPAGVTCVTFLDLKSCPVLWDCMGKLKREIEKKFPGRYFWFDEKSLHCTIRAMDK